MKKSLNLASLAMCVVAVVMTGCGPSEDLTANLPPAGRAVQTPVFNPDVEAGVPVTQETAPEPLAELVSAVGPRLGSRVDPFALMPAERAFERQQEAERLFAEGGAFPTLFEYKPEFETQAPLPIEVQPYRRLSGVVIGPAVVALLEAEGEVHLVRPGSTIPGTNWKVISIDQDKAVLRRPGNVLPREITVKLEPAPAGSAPVQQGGPPAGFGGPPGGLGRPGAGGGIQPGGFGGASGPG